VFDAKGLISHKFEGRDMKHFPFTVFSKGGKPYIRVEYPGEQKEFSPEEISSMVLLKMKETTESYLGTTLNVSAAVPASRPRTPSSCTCTTSVTLSPTRSLPTISRPPTADKTKLEGAVKETIKWFEASPGGFPVLIFSSPPFTLPSWWTYDLK
ncbi:heat shock protein 70, partial [Mycena metata]